MQWRFADVKQLSPMWFGIRESLCRCTGSRVGDAIGVGYGSRENYWKEKCKSVKYTKPQFHPVVQQRLDHGNRFEDTAIALLFERHLQIPPEQMKKHLLRPGIVFYPEDCRLAASPDAMAFIGGQMCSIEVKCPYPDYEKNPLDMGIRTYRHSTYLPPSHACQMLAEMAATGTSKCYYTCLGLEVGATYKGTERFKYELVVEEYGFNRDLWYNRVWPRVRSFMDKVDCGVNPGRMPNGTPKYIKDQLSREFKPLRTASYEGRTCEIPCRVQ